MEYLPLITLIIAVVVIDTEVKAQWMRYNSYQRPYNYYNQSPARVPKQPPPPPPPPPPARFSPYTYQRSYVRPRAPIPRRKPAYIRPRAPKPRPKPRAVAQRSRVIPPPTASDLRPLIKNLKTIVPILVRSYVLPEPESASEKKTYIDAPVLKDNPVFEKIMKKWMVAHPKVVQMIKQRELAKRVRVNRYKDPNLDRIPAVNPYLYTRGGIPRSPATIQKDGCPMYVRTPGQFKYILGRAFDATIPAKRKYMKPVKGTTKRIDQIFAGRCWEFQKKTKQNPTVDCDALWSAFVKAFSYKGPCDVTYDDYKPFFDMIHEFPLVNRVLLWSGVKELVHSYALLSSKFTTVEDSFAGYLMRGLTWCGTKRSPGIDFNSCPYECAKQKPYWGQVAEKLAHRARGVVSVLVNGTRQHEGDKQIFPAFMLDSYLAQNQLPNLSPNLVSEVRIMVGHNNDRAVLENCNTCSIKAFRKAAMNFGLKTTCQDDPQMVRHLLCSINPQPVLCRFARAMNTI